MEFSSEQLNFFKFFSLVLDVFPVALRKVFVFMWDTRVATSTSGVPKWDDSVTVLNIFHTKEGGVKKVPTLNKSYKEWDCTGLFQATLFAQAFAMPDGGGGLSTLAKLYVKPSGLSAGTFHPSVVSPTGNTAETYAFALDQLRLLRNTLCHQISTRKIDKATFDHYILLAKDAFTALGQDVTRIDDIGKLNEDDFPTAKLQQVEDELKRKKDTAVKFKQLDDHLDKIKSQVEDVGSDVKDVKTEVTDVKTQVEDVGSDVKDVKIEVTHFKTQMEDVGSDVKDMKTEVTDVKTQVEDVGSDVKDVKTAVTDVKTQVEDVGSNVKDVKTGVTHVKTQMEVVESDVKDVKTEVTDVKTQVEDVGSDVKDVKTDVTHVKTQVEAVGSDVKDVKTEITDVKTQLEDVRSDVKELKAMKSKGPLVPDSCIPDKIPHFVGRQKECQTILNHFKDGNTRLIDVCGPPGFGKTSVAINVAHHLETPVYFVSLRGMKRKDDLVSHLLSIFTDAKQEFHMSPAHWLIQSLQQLQNPFVLILDNADDLLESGDTKLKEDVLRFIEDILAQCNYIKLLFTTRESLNYLSHKRPIHVERVGVLDEVASGRLVKSLLPNVSDDDCSSIVKACGQVPLAMRLMCSTVTEEHVSVDELLEELKISPLVEVLDNESFSDDARLKKIINTSFQRLTANERDAFVSLAVFPGCFGIDEAKAVLNLKTVPQTKKRVGSLKRKSLIDCSDDFETFTIHSLLRSFIEEKRITDQQTEAVYVIAQHRFYSYQISSFGVANEQFLTGHSNEALVTFLRQRESIILSLIDGLRNDELYREAVEVLSKGELFLYSILPDEEVLFQKLYDTAVNEAQKRKNVDDERTLLASKSFSHWGWFSSDGQTWGHSLQAGYTDLADFPAKLVCYYGIHQILCGELEEGMSSLKSSLDRLGSSCDETVLKLLAYQVLAFSHWRKEEHKMASDFVDLCRIEAKAGLACVGMPFSFSLNDASVQHDAFLFSVTSTLILLSVRRKKIDSFNYNAMVAALSGRYEYFSNAGIKQLSMISKLGISELKELELITDEFEVSEESLYSFVDLIDQLSQDSLITLQTSNQLSEKALHVLENLFSVGGNFVSRNYFAALFFKQPIKDMGNFLKSIENDLDLDFEELARGCDIHGKFLHLMNDYSGSIESHQRAITIREKHIGDHVDTASSLTSIGCVYFKMDNEIEAVKSFQSALELRKQFDIYDHVDTSNIYYTLGKNHFSLGNYEKAIEAHLQALKLRKKHLGEHPLTAESLDDIAVVYCTMGEKGIHTVTSCHNLAETSLELRSYMEALTFSQQVLDMRLKFLSEHVDTAKSLHTLGVINYKMGDKSSAVEALQKASDMRSNLLGDHKDTAWSYHWLGRAQHNMGDLHGALESLQKALQMRKKRSIADDPNMAEIVHEMGRVHYTMGDYQSAKEQFQDAFHLFKKLLDKHENTAASCHALSVAYFSTRNYTEALEFCQKALTMRLELLGEHRQTAESFHTLGRIHYDMRDYPSAIKELQKASDIRSNVLGDHKDTAESYHWLGASQHNMRDLNGALESLQKASEMRKEILGRNHPSTAESLKLLNRVRYEASDWCSIM